MIESERHLSTYSDAQKMDMIATAERSIFSRFYLKGSVIRERHTTKYSFVVNPITSTETHWAYIYSPHARASQHYQTRKQTTMTSQITLAQNASFAYALKWDVISQEGSHSLLLVNMIVSRKVNSPSFHIPFVWWSENQYLIIAFLVRSRDLPRWSEHK